ALVEDWQAQEERLAIEVDARVYAFVASAREDLDRAFPTGARTQADAPRLRFATIYGLLWPRGSLGRAAALQSYNPYQPHPATDRSLVLTSLDTTTPVVRLADDSWRDRLAEALLATGAALLSVEPDRMRALRNAATELQGLPIDAGYLL